MPSKAVRWEPAQSLHLLPGPVLHDRFALAVERVVRQPPFADVDEEVVARAVDSEAKPVAQIAQEIADVLTARGERAVHGRERASAIGVPHRLEDDVAAWRRAVFTG